MRVLATLPTSLTTTKSATFRRLYCLMQLPKFNSPIRYVAAPMVAISDYAFRCLCRRYRINIHLRVFLAVVVLVVAAPASMRPSCECGMHTIFYTIDTFCGIIGICINTTIMMMFLRSLYPTLNNDFPFHDYYLPNNPFYSNNNKEFRRRIMAITTKT